VRNAQRLANLVVPLFVDTFQRAEELALAMQARCYHGGRGRTHLYELTLTPTDYLAQVLSLLVLVGVIITRYFPLP
jgi:energy-coupling factor transport system permease protein